MTFRCLRTAAMTITIIISHWVTWISVCIVKKGYKPEIQDTILHIEVRRKVSLKATQMFPRLPACVTLVADTLRSMETQYSFCVPCVCAPKKHHEQQSFTRAFTLIKKQNSFPSKGVKVWQRGLGTKLFSLFSWLGFLAPSFSNKHLYRWKNISTAIKSFLFEVNTSSHFASTIDRPSLVNTINYFDQQIN